MPAVSSPKKPEPLPTPQSTATPAWYEPDDEDFPANVNPLTGLPVLEPALLNIPAVLVSISHFPAVGRPQAGLSFAPMVYEFSITGGESRFLAAFYGEFPRPEVPVSGPCPVRMGAFSQSGTLVGNRVWFDEDGDGRQDIGESGVPGVCVNLLDVSGNLVQSSTTDTNGVFGFNVLAGASHTLQFERPQGMEFSPRDIGHEDLDSDVDPHDGTTPSFPADASTLDWDAGLRWSRVGPTPTPDLAAMPEAEVGPVRSGRLLYADIAASFTNSCLIYAFADPTILYKLPHCAFVSHEEANGGDMISIERMRAVAEDNMRHTAGRAFDYTSNVYSELPPRGGMPGQELRVFFGNINQSAWIYDPLYRAYLRHVDNADLETRGELHPDIDRLTGRQIHVENVIVIMVDTEVVSRTNLDIDLNAGNSGAGTLFRNGQQFPITWSTKGGEYEDQTGLRKPIRFFNPDGSLAALRPGHIWVIIVTPFSRIESLGSGSFLVKYAPPAGEAQ